MWLMAGALTGLVAGYMGGLLLVDLVPMVGLLLVQKPVGAPYLQWYVGGLGALVGALLGLRHGRRVKVGAPG